MPIGNRKLGPVQFICLRFMCGDRTPDAVLRVVNVTDGKLPAKEENERSPLPEWNFGNLHTKQGNVSYGTSDQQPKTSDVAHEMGAGAERNNGDRKETGIDEYTTFELEEAATDEYTTAELEEVATLDELRRSRRTIKEPTWMSNYIKGKK